MRKFGMLFQGAALFDSLPVWENVAFGLIQGRGMARAKARDIAIEKLAKVGLTRGRGVPVARRNCPAACRSASAWPAPSPPIRKSSSSTSPPPAWIPIMADIINDLIISTVRDVGATALSITHDMVSARKISDRIAMLYGGKIIWHGPTGQIDHSGNAYVDQFIHGRAEGPIKMAVKA